MTFDEFINKWNGKPVDFDGVYPNQCMDLMHQYAYEVLGITDKTVLARPWAARVWTEFGWPQFFDKIINTPNGIPQKGDIMIWKEALNYVPALGHGYGHVSMVTEANVWNFKSFDANWPTGSLPHIQWHNYNYVWGWLRPKKLEDVLYNQVVQIVNGAGDAGTKIAQLRALLR
jgi:hypothetical protein